MYSDATTSELSAAHERFDELEHVVDTNVTGSIAGFIPGTFLAVYNGTKAFIDPFSFALRAELNDSGVTVTCLMPGATETDFFARADMLDTAVLRHDVGYAAGRSADRTPGPGGHRRQHLRIVHGQRRLYARIPALCARGLHRVEHA